jgi:hypothetical protein
MLSRACLDGSGRSARWSGPEVRRGQRPGAFRRRWLSVALVALGVLALAPAGAWAQTLDQQQENHPRDVGVQGPDTGTPISRAQTFTAGLSGQLDRIDLALSKSTTTDGPLTVEIRNVDPSGAPGTDVLASAAVPAASVPTGGSAAIAFVEVPFDPTAAVAAGGRYAIVAYTGGANVYRWGADFENPYAGGSLFGSVQSPPSAWGANTTDDLAFRTYVAPADTTAPTSTATAEPVAQGQPPVTVTATATFKDTAGATVGTVGPVNCWNSRGVRITLNATDNTGGSGVATLSYSASGAQPIPSTSVPASALPTAVTITTPGVTTLSYQATDNAGNQEQPNSETVLIGPAGRPPFACALATPASFTIPAHGSVTVTGTATIGQGTFPFSTTIRY